MQVNKGIVGDYYEQKAIDIFPSSNATDAGKITSEENLRGTVTRITSRNYCLKGKYHPYYTNRKDEGDYEFTPRLSGNVVSITMGKANIRGYDVVTYSNLDILTKPSSTGTYPIILKLIYDGSGHLVGDEVTESSSPVYYCAGIYALFGTDDVMEDMKNILVLGTVYYNKSTDKFSNLIPNTHRFTRINSEDVDINNPEYDSINLEELVNELLDTFIMRDGSNRLEGKGGDFYGSLYGRTKSDTDLSHYRIKISLDNDTQEIIVKPNTRSAVFQAILGSSDAFGPYLKLGSETINYYGNKLNITGNPLNINPKVYINNNFYSNNSKIALSTLDNEFIIGSKTYDTDGYTLSKGNIVTSVGTDSNGVDYSSLGIYVGNKGIKSLFDGRMLSIIPTDTQEIDFQLPVNLLQLRVLNTGGHTSIFKDHIFYSNTNVNMDVNDTTGIIVKANTSSTRYIKVYDSTNSANTYAQLDSKGQVSLCGKTGTSNLSKVYFVNRSNTTTNDVEASITLYNTYKNAYQRTLVADASTFYTTGDIRATGKVYNAVYNDIVEFMRKDPTETVNPGDVICVDEYGVLYRRVKSEDDLHRIVGVCSSEDTYGYALGGEGLNDDEKIPVGLAGRVYVNVADEVVYNNPEEVIYPINSDKSNSIEFIKPGDDLTVDPRTGLAIKSFCKDDVIIGKALSYAKDGKVYMLIK